MSAMSHACTLLFCACSRHAAKYFEAHHERLYWPRGAKSQSSVDYVRKIEPLSRLICRRDDQLYLLVRCCVRHPEMRALRMLKLR
jgi:hypothetical protein